jgi:hypothetical protein
MNFIKELLQSPTYTIEALQTKLLTKPATTPKEVNGRASGLLSNSNFTLQPHMMAISNHTPSILNTAAAKAKFEARYSRIPVDQNNQHLRTHMNLTKNTLQ